jgi:hypothetical protein
VAITYNTPDGSATVDAGTYTATGTFAGNQHYTSATGTATIVIGQAMPTVTVNPISVTYDGSAHGTTGEAFGVNGGDLGPVAITYDGSPAPPVHAGTYTATGTFSGTQDYTSATGTATITIGQATPSVTVNPVSVTYDGNVHGTTGEAFGVGGVDLGPVAITYSTADGSAPVHAGTYIATGTFGGNQDYFGATGTATIAIDKAIPTASIEPVAETPYDGSAHGTTGQVVGVNGVVLSNTVVYTDAKGNESSAPPVHAGTYTATVSYPGDNDYTSASASTTIVIDKADAKITITPFFVQYDGFAHQLTGRATGVQGEDLSSLLDLGGVGIDAGTYWEFWTFNWQDQNPDYNSTQGLDPFIIDPAPLTVTVPSLSKTYGQAIDLAAALGRTVPTGVNGETLSIAYASAGAAASIPDGSYPISAQLSDGSGKLSNYSVQVIPGTLTVVGQQSSPTATIMTIPAPTPLAGVDTVTLTSTVTSQGLGRGAPTGTVDFFDTSTGHDLGSAPVVNGVASLNAGTFTAGTHTITATYSGDSNSLPSSGTGSLTALAPASLSGTVFADFNQDGQIDFGEKGVSGVPVQLSGTDDLGRAVGQTVRTDSDGAYLFLNLRPGSYDITKTTQPAGYTAGIDSVGTAGGSVSADQFSVTLSEGVNGLNYNYGERPAAGGPVQGGQTAPVGFWNNKNGQALIKSLNGGGTSHQLGDWLAATFVNMYGADSANDLAGKNNAYIAALFQQDFLQKGQKLDAQVLATALSVYATNATLDNTKVAASYGFTVSGYGVGAASFSVGSDGDAFGVANNTTLPLMDLLLAADAQAVNGLLYNGNTTRRNEANNVFSAVNQAGSL